MLPDPGETRSALGALGQLPGRARDRGARRRRTLCTLCTPCTPCTPCTLTPPCTPLHPVHPLHPLHPAQRRLRPPLCPQHERAQPKFKVTCSICRASGRWSRT